MRQRFIRTEPNRVGLHSWWVGILTFVAGVGATVWTVSTVSHFPPTFFTMVSVPSPLELKARPVPGSYPAASGPEPIGAVPSIFMAL